MTIDYNTKRSIFNAIKRQREMLEDMIRTLGVIDLDTVYERIKYNGMVELLDALGIYDDYERYIYDEEI